MPSRAEGSPEDGPAPQRLCSAPPGSVTRIRPRLAGALEVCPDAQALQSTSHHLHWPWNSDSLPQWASLGPTCPRLQFSLLSVFCSRWNSISSSLLRRALACKHVQSPDYRGAWRQPHWFKVSYLPPQHSGRVSNEPYTRPQIYQPRPETRPQAPGAASGVKPSGRDQEFPLLSWHQPPGAPCTALRPDTKSWPPRGRPETGKRGSRRPMEPGPGQHSTLLRSREESGKARRVVNDERGQGHFPSASPHTGLSRRPGTGSWTVQENEAGNHNRSAWVKGQASLQRLLVGVSQALLSSAA